VHGHAEKIQTEIDVKNFIKEVGNFGSIDIMHAETRGI